MKLRRLPTRTKRTRAFAVILILGLLAYMGSFALHNTRNLAHLEMELRVVEHDQIKRLGDAADETRSERRTSNAQR